MNSNNSLYLIFIFTLAAISICACSPDTPKERLPALNDENCKVEVIAKIKDKGGREEFAGRCFRRGPKFSPSPDRKW